MQLKNIFVAAVVVWVLIICNCIEQVKFIHKTESSATLIIIRDGGNEEDEIYVYVDSLLVGTTFQDAVSYITIPTGYHYIFFEWEDDFDGFYSDFGAEDVFAVNQFVLNAYVYKQFNNTGLDDSSFSAKINNPKLKQHHFSYLNAKEQMSTHDFNKNVISLGKSFEMRGGGFKIRIQE